MACFILSACHFSFKGQFSSASRLVALFLRCQYTKFDVRIGLPVQKILGIYCVSISQHDDLDLLTSKQVHELRVQWASIWLDGTSIQPNFGFLGLSVLELGRGTGQTDRERHRRPFYNAAFPSLWGRGHKSLTLIPRQRGKHLSWDVTVICLLADSYVEQCQEAGSAAELAATRKLAKYNVV